MSPVLLLLMNVIAVAALVLAGCADTPAAVGGDYRERAVTRIDGGLQVSTSVLSAMESGDLYGVRLAAHIPQ